MPATKMRLPKKANLVWLVAVFMFICSSCSQTESGFRTELVKLKTADGVSPIALSQVGLSLVAFIGVYGLLGALGYFLMIKYAIKGPETAA